MARSTKGWLYLFLRTWNDVDAVRKGRVARRVGRRVYGKAAGRLARSLFG